MASAQETKGVVSEALKQMKMASAGETEGLILTDIGSAKRSPGHFTLELTHDLLFQVMSGCVRLCWLCIGLWPLHKSCICRHRRCSADTKVYCGPAPKFKRKHDWSQTERLDT